LIVDNEAIIGMCRQISDEAQAIMSYSSGIDAAMDETLIAIYHELRMDELGHLQKLAIALTEMLDGKEPTAAAKMDGSEPVFAEDARKGGFVNTGDTVEFRTVNGNVIPIQPGESMAEAFKNFLEYNGDVVAREYKEAVDPKVLSFIKEVDKKGPKGVKPFELGEIDKAHANKLKALTGADYSGYKAMLTGDTVEHIEKRHGKNGSSDMSMADPKDIARIGYVINTFDEAKKAGKTSAYLNANGTPAEVILLSKKINGNYYVAEAVPDTKRKQIYVQSAYKKKP
jgi:hypothetical protein